MNLSKTKMRKHILKKMARHHWWGEKHTAFDNIPKGVPKHLRKAIKKRKSIAYKRRIHNQETNRIWSSCLTEF